MDDHQLTKIFVQSDEYSTFEMSALQKLFITGIFRPIAGAHDVVPRLDEVLTGLAPDAAIEKQLQKVVSTTGGSTRSWATTRWA